MAYYADWHLVIDALPLDEWTDDYGYTGYSPEVMDFGGVGGIIDWGIGCLAGGLLRAEAFKVEVIFGPQERQYHPGYNHPFKVEANAAQYPGQEHEFVLASLGKLESKPPGWNDYYNWEQTQSEPNEYPPSVESSKLRGVHRAFQEGDRVEVEMTRTYIRWRINGGSWNDALAGVPATFKSLVLGNTYPVWSWLHFKNLSLITMRDTTQFKCYAKGFIEDFPSSDRVFWVDRFGLEERPPATTTRSMLIPTEVPK